MPLSQITPQTLERFGVHRRNNINFDRQLVNFAGDRTLPNDLPLAHVTAAWSAREILFEGKLTTSKCSVFKSDLLYFFCLRPAYRSKFGMSESHQISRFPVVFVLDSDALPSPRHAYPFDTGGACNGSFDSQADAFVPLEDYALEPNWDAISKFISWAFGSLENYYNGTLRENIDSEIRPFQSVVVSYVDIARLGRVGSNEHDTRACSIEVASHSNIDLRNHLRLLIAPKQYIEGNDPVLGLIEKLKNPNIDIRLYDWQPSRAPDEFQKDIFRIARNYYREIGLMNGA